MFPDISGKFSNKIGLLCDVIIDIYPRLHTQLKRDFLKNASLKIYNSTERFVSDCLSTIGRTLQRLQNCVIKEKVGKRNCTLKLMENSKIQANIEHLS